MPRSNSRFSIFAKCVAVAMMALVIGILWFAFNPPLSRHVTFPSPDGRYKLVVYKYKTHTYIPTMPGQGGDAPGVVRLLDSKNNVLQEAKLEMARNVGPSEIVWEKDKVHIKLIAEWPLPE